MRPLFSTAECFRPTCKEKDAHEVKWLSIVFNSMEGACLELELDALAPILTELVIKLVMIN
jgi:hypothetical protein